MSAPVTRRMVLLYVLAILGGQVLLPIGPQARAQVGGPGPVIIDFNPKRGAPGTQIEILGENFPDDPNAVCLVVQPPRTSVPIPLDILDLSKTQITAVLGPWATPDFPPGPIVLTVGEGAEAAVDQKEFADVTVKAPIRAWRRDLRHTERAVSAGDFAPLAGELPEIFLASRPPQNGTLIVDPLRIPVWDDCESRICEVIRRSLSELLGVEVRCDLSADGGIQFGLTNGVITHGVLTIGGRPSPDGSGTDAEIRLVAFDEAQGTGVCLHAPSLVLQGDPDRPIITGFSPGQGGPGTEVTITGRNFLPGPDMDLDDLSVVLQAPETGQLIPLHVVEATDTEIRAVVGIGPVAGKPVDFEPSPIVVTIGDGINGLLKPIPEAGQPGPTWTWALSPTLPLPPPKAVSGESFQLASGEPPDDTAWFVSGPPRDGELTLFLQDDWEAGSEVEIAIDLRDSSGNRSYSLHAPKIVFPNGGRADSAAGQLCRFVEMAFEQRGIDVECAVAGGRATVASAVLRFPDGTIDEGGFSISISPRPVERPQPVITDFGPTAGGPGDVITIQGSGFGKDPGQVSLNLVSGADAIPLDIVDISDTTIMARLGGVHPDWVGKPAPIEPGPILISRGRGVQDIMKPTPKPWRSLDVVRVWEANGGLSTVSAQVFSPTSFTTSVESFDKPVEALVNDVEKGAGPPGEPVGCFYGSVDGNGRLCVTLSGDCPPGVEMSVRFRAHNSTRGVGSEVDYFRVRLDGGTPRDCAQTFSDGIRWSLVQLLGSDVDIEIIENADGSVKLAASLPGGVPVEWGAFELCILPSGAAGGIRGGDCNADGVVDITDAICLLGFLFLGTPSELPCGDPGEPEPDASDLRLLDWNGDGGTPDISDVIAMLAHLFLGEAPHVLGRGCVDLPGCPSRCKV